MAAGFLLLLIAACLAAPLIAPYGAEKQDLSATLRGPSLRHLLGTDRLGRDVLSRLLYGGNVSLAGVAEVLCVALAIGLPLGVLAGFRRGIADGVLSRAADVGLAMPAIVILLVVFAVFDNNEFAVMIALGVLFAPYLFRVARGASLAVRNELHVTAARVAGLGEARIALRHVLPRISGPLIVNCAVIAASSLVIQTGLNYLGLGVQAPRPSWGGLVADAQTVLQQQSWLLVPSGGVIGLTVIAFILVGDGARDALSARTAGRGAPPRPATPPAVAASRGPAERPADRDALCSVRNLSVSVSRPDGEIAVVSGVDLDLRAGEALGVVGESGCGKTLTALSIIGMLPTGVRVASGTCLFAGTDLFAAPAAERLRMRGKQIAYISQDPMASLDPAYTVGSLLSEIVRRHTRVPRQLAKTRAVELLDQVRIPEPARVAGRYPHEISGGMAQRVCIAAAIAAGPRLLVADEPTTALDVTVQAEILDLLRSLQVENNMALLLVTHDWGVVADSCDRAAVFYAGQVVEYGATASLIRAPEHPYTQALLASNPQLAEGSGPLPSMGGSVPRPDEWARARGCRFAPRCALATADCRAGEIPLEPGRAHRAVRCIRRGSTVAADVERAEYA